MANIRATSVGTFKNLNDTPEVYTGQSGKYVKVNSSEDGLEFVSSTSGDTSNVLLTNVPCSPSVFEGACVRMSGGTALNASAASLATSNFIGICESKHTATLCNIRVLGTSEPVFNNLDESKEYFLSVTDGEMSESLPTGSGTVILRIGQPFSSSEMLVLKGSRTVRI